MRRHNVPRSWLAGAALLAACSGGGAHPSTLPIAHTVAPSSAAASTTAMSSIVGPVTTEATTTNRSAPSSSPVSSPVSSGVHLSAGGPWQRVPSAPGITTPGLVYQLMPKLWVYLPTEEDISKGIVWTLRAPDVPIIEAYLHARLVYFQAITSNPIDTSSPDWQRWYTDGGAQLKRLLEPAITGGWTANLDGGVVLRPEVIGDGRDKTHAVVFDCMLDGGVFLLPNGRLAPGSTMGVTKTAGGFKLALAGDSWMMAQVGEQPDACVA